METLSHIDGERPMPNVSSVQRTRWVRGAVVVGCLLLVSGGAVMAIAKFSQPADEATTQRDMRVASSVPNIAFDIEPEYVAPPAPVAAMPVAATPPPPKQYSAPAKRVQRPVVDRSASGINIAAIQQPTAQGVQVAQAGGTGSGLFGGAESSDKLTGTRTAAFTMANHDKTLVQGMTIPCVLDTRIVTSVAGVTTCNTTADVRSATGEYVVLPEGTRLTGEYRTATRAGNRRIFVKWNRALTPAGVVANLESPATGPLGASGIEGYVDTHFWQRFGGAMLLSLVDDLATAATRGDSNAEIVIGGAANTSSELAAEVLRNTINIQPTVYTHHGSVIAVTVARDIDFSGVVQ